MDLVQSGPWTPGPCFVLTLWITCHARLHDTSNNSHGWPVVRSSSKGNFHVAFTVLFKECQI